AASRRSHRAPAPLRRRAAQRRWAAARTDRRCAPAAASARRSSAALRHMPPRSVKLPAAIRALDAWHALRASRIHRRRRQKRWNNAAALARVATLFDYNGVLVDDEHVHLEGFRRVLAPLGIQVSERQYLERYIGYDDVGAFRAMLEDAGLPTDDARVR